MTSAMMIPNKDMMNKPVKECMTENLMCCTTQDTLQSVASKMKGSNIGCLGVFSNNNLIGMITDRDLVTRCMAEGKDYRTMTVGDCMTKEVMSIAPEDTMQRAFQLMEQKNVRRLVVWDKANNKFGLISKSDMLCGNKA